MSTEKPSRPVSPTFFPSLAFLLFGVALALAFVIASDKVGKSIGQGIREFKKGLKETEDDAKRDDSSSRRAALPHEQTMPTPETTGEQTHSR